ncbi:hypothetical protein ACFRIB_52560 [Streptomyces mirabilis]|uniref:hypothetical protein n=1 Tax=Streptomyces mirabilis TaxID=68239 RepID=UPI0036B1D103
MKEILPQPPPYERLALVDLRLGGSHGTVFLWDHERWGLGVPMCDSVGSMLRDVAAALETQTPVLLQHAPLGGAESTCVGEVDEQGDLNWKPAG